MSFEGITRFSRFASRLNFSSFAAVSPLHGKPPPVVDSVWGRPAASVFGPYDLCTSFLQKREMMGSVSNIYLGQGDLVSILTLAYNHYMPRNNLQICLSLLAYKSKEGLGLRALGLAYSCSTSPSAGAAHPTEPHGLGSRTPPLVNLPLIVIVYYDMETATD